jgi:hypothetical protein
MLRLHGLGMKDAEVLEVSLADVEVEVEVEALLKLF